MCFLPGRKQITRDMCFPGEGTHNTRDNVCFRAWGAYVTTGMCFAVWGTHITRDMCYPGGGTHITRDMCFPGDEHKSQGICVSQVGNTYP